MPVIVEKDGHQRQFGDVQFKRLKGQGKLNGYSLVKTVSFKKSVGGELRVEPDKVTLPEEVTKFQQKTVAEREQDALNKAYVNMGKKGMLFEVPEDYTGDPAMLEISEIPARVTVSEEEEAAKQKAAAEAQQDALNKANKASSSDQKVPAPAKGGPAGHQPKKH